jgi:hypothetical protein
MEAVSGIGQPRSSETLQHLRQRRRLGRNASNSAIFWRLHGLVFRHHGGTKPVPKGTSPRRTIVERAAKVIIISSAIYLVAEAAVQKEKSLLAQLMRLLSE